MVASMGFAQKDVTSLYITNATLSEGMTVGWNVTYTGSGNYSHFNTVVQGNNTVGYATEAYAGWGELAYTAYSMTQTITVPAGDYRLVNYSFYREGQNYNTDVNTSLAYLKAGENKVAIKTLGSITAAGYANSQAEGANCFDSKMYRNVVEFTSDGSPIEIGVYGTFDQAYCWCIVGMFELFDMNDLASVDSPTDVTYTITNSGFEYRNLSNWDNNVTVGNNQYSNSGNFDPYKAGLGFYETWTPSGGGGKLGDAGSFTQTLANMPAGLYELSVYAKNIEQGNGNAGGTGMFLSANSDQKEIGIAGQYKVRTTLATDGDLTIGVKFDNCSGNWAAFDRFELLFYGDPTEAYKELLAEKVAEAQALVNSGTLPTAEATALQGVINDNNKPSEYTTEEEFNTAISNIEAEMNYAQSLVEPYNTAKDLLATAGTLTANYPNLHAAVEDYAAVIETFTTIEEFNDFNSTLTGLNDAFSEWLSIKHYADDLVVVPSDNAEAKAILAGEIETCESDVQNADISPLGIATVNGAILILKEAMTTYAGDANPVGDDEKFNLTFMLTNPDVTSFWTGAWDVRPAGWYTDQEGGNFQVMANEEMGPGGEVFMEYWSENAKTSNFSLYQNVTLDKGTYKMTGRVGLNQDTGGNNANMTFSANETNGTKIAAGPLSDQEVEFVNTTDDTEVKIGIKAQAGNTYRWIGINNIKLYKIPAKTYTIDEDVDWDYTTVGAGDVTLNRNIKVGINTLVLPFSMTQAEVESTFGEDSKVYIVHSYDSKTDNITFDTQDGIEPNLPCLLKATVAGTSYEIEGRTIVSTENDAPEYTLDESVSMIGGYAATNDIAANSYNYVISGDKIYFADVALTMKGTRAYIKTASSNPGARELVMILDDDPTAINSIEASEEAGALKDGKYFINGRFVIVNNGLVFGANGQLLK